MRQLEEALQRAVVAYDTASPVPSDARGMRDWLITSAWAAQRDGEWALMDGLANELSQQGKYLEAEPLSRWALAGRETELGPSHPNTLRTMNNLARLLADQGQFQDAAPMFRRALAGAELALHEEVGAS